MLHKFSAVQKPAVISDHSPRVITSPHRHSAVLGRDQGVTTPPSLPQAACHS